MKNLRKLAKGRECEVRIPGICNHNPETTVLAHYRIAGLCGTGIKPHDLIGALACSSCHDEIDRRTQLISYEESRQFHAEGVMRTQDLWIKEGIINA